MAHSRSRILTVKHESWPIAGDFTISRGTKTHADVVIAEIAQGGHRGRGECVPYPRYGESVNSVMAQISQCRTSIEAGLGRVGLSNLLPRGAARNALDCALWDLEAKSKNTTVWKLAHLSRPKPVTSALTISLGSPAAMAAAARKASHMPLLKLKLDGSRHDLHRLKAVRKAAPDAELIVDANEAWPEARLPEYMAACHETGIALIEQPLPAGKDDALLEINRIVPVCADESIHGIDSLAAVAQRYDAINIKLDKTGGLTAALELVKAARALGLQTMTGCMVATSLAMAPALLLAGQTQIADLDGPLLLANDRLPGLTYENARILPATRDLWG